MIIYKNFINNYIEYNSNQLFWNTYCLELFYNMSDSLTQLKARKIAALNNNFNMHVAALKNYYSSVVNNINNSRYSIAYKKNAIILITNQTNARINALQNKLKADILSIQQLAYNTVTRGTNKNALIIGINYIGTSNKLEGCINDAKHLSTLMTSSGFQNIKLLTDHTLEKPTRNNILNGFTNLLANSKTGDVVFFSYSGHGSYTVDKNNEEATGYDQMIVPCDFKCIVDDDLKKIIDANLKIGVTLIALFDSCFSGSVLDLKYQYSDSLDNNNFTENNSESITKGNVIMISGCSDIQTSADAKINNKAQGALTWAFLQTFNSSKNLTWQQLLQGMRDLLKNNGFDQIPQLSSGKFIDINTQAFV